jgi:hypothetical protein
LYDAGVGTYQASFVENGIAANGRTWKHGCEVTNLTIVTNQRSVRKVDMLANCHQGADANAREYYSAFSDGGGRRNVYLRMNDGGRRKAILLNSCGNFPTRLTPANSDDEVGSIQSL